MKKLKNVLKGCLCLVLAGVATIGFVACDAKETAETTETIIQTSTSIIPVEYSKETAMGIVFSAYQKLILSEKSSVEYEEYTLDDNQFAQGMSGKQTTLFKGKDRYTYIATEGMDTFAYGKYDDKNYLLNITKNTKKELTATATTGTESGPEVGAVPAGSTIDLYDIVYQVLSFVTAGRYYDGVTYVNGYYDDGEGNITNIEVRIVDDLIADIRAVSHSDTDGMTITYISFAYGDSVDVSMIPSSVEGFTTAA